MRNRSWRPSRSILAILLATAAAFALPWSTAQAADPPGNNGTVKIDDRPFDEHPDNEPHVGCLFQVDFYGFDEGDYNAKVTFTIMPPSGRDAVLLRDIVFIGEDPAGGGTDLDAQRTYNLGPALSAYKKHPKQGYHVKLTVNAPGSIGADTKYKVFWVQKCGYGYPY
jgi:hypothetical protein